MCRSLNPGTVWWPRPLRSNLPWMLLRGMKATRSSRWVGSGQKWLVDPDVVPICEVLSIWTNSINWEWDLDPSKFCLAPPWVPFVSFFHRLYRDSLVFFCTILFDRTKPSINGSGQKEPNCSLTCKGSVKWHWNVSVEHMSYSTVKPATGWSLQLGLTSLTQKSRSPMPV